MKPKNRDNKIIRISKKTKPDSESKYRPEALGENRMKVTQLSMGRLPQLLNCSPEKKGEGDMYEKTEKGRFQKIEEAKAVEIEVAVGCLFGSRLNDSPWERMRPERGGEPKASKGPEARGKTRAKKKINKQPADQAAPG